MEIITAPFLAFTDANWSMI